MQQSEGIDLARTRVQRSSSLFQPSSSKVREVARNSVGERQPKKNVDHVHKIIEASRLRQCKRDAIFRHRQQQESCNVHHVQARL